MWFYTSLGITIIDSNDNIFNINQKGKFASTSTNLHSQTKFNDSTFYMGNKNGLFHINIKKIINQIDTIDSKIGISNIKINGNSFNEIKKDKNPINYDYINNIELKHNQKNIDITFSSLSFSNKNSIKYRLLPMQKEWKNGEYGNNNFTINNIKRGNYTLECRSINKNGITSTITKQINITIKKAIYQKIWFIICIVILMVISLSFIHILFKRHIKRKNKKLKKLIQIQTIKLLNNNKELEEKSKELSSINKTKTTLFSVIAHDLLGPLGTIKSTNNLLTENYEDFKENDMLKGLLASNNESLSSLYELLQNLLFWSKHQQSDIRPNPILFNLNDLCQKIFDFLKFTLSSKKNVLIFDIPKDFNIYADKQMIHTILRNIISNSNKFTNNGTITVTAKETKNFIHISIKDTGIGMSKEKANKLFSNNNIFSTQGTAGETGTGLGLKVSKDFILKHNGTIHVESTEKKGTIITFTISKGL